MRKIAALYAGVSYQYRSWNEPKYKQYLSDILYVPELTETSFDEFDAIIVPSRLHAGLMERITPWIQRFADNGGTVVLFWPQSADCVPLQNWENRPTNFWWWLDKDAKSGLELQQPEHNLFKYLTLEDATWHYHGVFWPPAGAEVLITTEDNGAILYIDKVSSAGTWVVTTLDPEFHFGSYFMPATERFLDGFFPWLAEGEIA
ncbi:hypothetical protein [Paenibacillus agricola]|uniref:ThuA-like domain-containing protein n=1 Tax=Paenibacillus agricola TaxID=2716264 RepID=A0ABX0JFS0_9BACL|nr:hypothetical protein [Paenibacillus agricola]NHN32535.1 hypothetical protein [Paenibacillus agricola]